SFFFSSRRRHTRWPRDWSSDVCSSDLNETLAKQLWPDQDPLGKRLVSVAGYTGDATFTVVGVASDTRFRELKNVGPVAYFVWERSEERRVGKEWKCGGAGDEFGVKEEV